MPLLVSPWPSGPWPAPASGPLRACCRDTGTLVVMMLRILVIRPGTLLLLSEPTDIGVSELMVLPSEF